MLADGTVEPVVVEFPREVRRVRRFDPTHDEIASWDEDVLKVLPYTAADGWSASGQTVAEWAARVTPLWRAGLAIPGAGP